MVLDLDWRSYLGIQRSRWKMCVTVSTPLCDFLLQWHRLVELWILSSRVCFDFLECFRQSCLKMILLLLDEVQSNYWNESVALVDACFDSLQRFLLLTVGSYDQVALNRTRSPILHSLIVAKENALESLTTKLVDYGSGSMYRPSGVKVVHFLNICLHYRTDIVIFSSRGWSTFCIASPKRLPQLLMVFWRNQTGLQSLLYSLVIQTWKSLVLSPCSLLSCGPAFKRVILSSISWRKSFTIFRYLLLYEDGDVTGI